MRCFCGNRRGFAIAAVLYALGLVGLLGGLFASNVMPSIKLALQAQNAISDKNAIINAANYLPAASVIGSDGLTFCPPRSATASSVCGSAPVTLTDLASVNASDSHLPADYALAASTGSPYEVGIFAAGGNVPQTDAQGRYWIVCRWENLESGPSSPAFSVIGAGANGAIQTKCGDTKATGDDLLQYVTVGAAAQRAATWNNKSNGSATFGADGSQVSVDANGNISATSLTASGAITAASGMLGSLSVTNGLTAGNVATTGDVTISGNLAVDGTTNLIGALSGNSGAFSSALTAQTVATTGNITVGGNLGVGASNPAAGIDVNSNAMFVARLSNSAAATAQIVIQDYYGGYGARLAFFDGPTLGWFIGEGGNKRFYIENAATGKSPIVDTLSGLLSLGEAEQMYLPPSGGVGIGTNAPATTLDVRGTASISGAFSSASVTTTGVATIGGTLNGSNAVFTGNVQAASFSGGGISMSSGGITGSGASTLGDLTVSSLTDTGSASAATLNVSGATSTGNLTVNGSLSAGTLTASDVSTGKISSSGLAVWATNDNAIWAASNISEVAYFATYGGANATIQVDAIDGGQTSISFLNKEIPQWYVGASNTDNFFIWDDTNQKDALTIQNATGLLALGEASQLYLPASGGVGIGTNAPTKTLDVLGTAAITSSSATAFSIGPSEAGYPTLNIDNSMPSQVCGIDIIGAPQYGYVTIFETGSLQCSFAILSSGNASYNAAGATYIQTGGMTMIDVESTGVAIGSATTSASVLGVYGGVSIGTGYIATAAPTNGLIVSGNVGIGTTAPQATLDVNGYARLAAHTSAPTTCNGTTKGSIAFALTAKRLCVCNGSSWVFDYNNAACTW